LSTRAWKNSGTPGSPGPPKLIDTTDARSSTAYWNAPAMASEVIPLSGCATLSGMMRQFHPAPAMPSLLSVAAASMPAQNVPWKPTSIPEASDVYSGLGSLSPTPKSHPSTSSTNPFPSSSSPLPGISPGFLQMRLARSGCDVSTPVSRMAMTTDVSPRAISQAYGRRMSAKSPSSTYHW